MFGRSVVRVVDLDARARRRARAREDLEGLLVGVAWTMFGWRVELAAFAVLAGVDRLLAGGLGEVVAAAVVLVVVVAVIGWRPSRTLVWRVLYAMRIRRAWADAAIDAGVAAGPFRSPGVRRVARIPAGDRLRVRMRRGQSVPMLEARREELAACMRLRDVRVLRDPKDAGEADVVLVRRDPFENAAPMPWPCAEVVELSLWEPIPVGVDEQGETVAIELAERNVLLGGEPGAGKSVALSTLIAAAALDPGTRVWLLDGKLVELAAWAPVAERAVGPDGEDALALLRELREVMDARYRDLLARGLRKIRWEEGLPLHLVVVRRARVLLDAAGQVAAPGVRRAAARSGRQRSRGRRDRVRSDAEAWCRRGAVGTAGSVRVPTRAAVHDSAGVGHDPWPGLGVERRGRVDDPRRTAWCWLPARGGRAADQGPWLLPR